MRTYITWLAASVLAVLGAYAEYATVPADLRAQLPGRGIVNYYEAQALVRHLEKLVQDPALARTAVPGRPAIGVVALYASQVELMGLRRAWSSHGKRRGTRIFAEFTFQVARRTAR